MANTRKSAKRARQADVRKDRNQMVRGATRTSIRNALEAIASKDLDKAKGAYQAAIRAMSKAASAGSIPKGRAARKISRLTRLAKKTIPTMMEATTGKKAK